MKLWAAPCTPLDYTAKSIQVYIIHLESVIIINRVPGLLDILFILCEWARVSGLFTSHLHEQHICLLFILHAINHFTPPNEKGDKIFEKVSRYVFFAYRSITRSDNCFSRQDFGERKNLKKKDGLLFLLLNN